MSRKSSTEVQINVDDFSEFESVDDDQVTIFQAEGAHGIGEHLNECQALLNFIKGNIGTGMLSMAVVLKYAGLWAGISMIIIAGTLATYLMHVLLRTANAAQKRYSWDSTKMDYTEAVFVVLKYGPLNLRQPKGKIKHTVNGFLIITQIGFCCVYTLFLTENIRYFYRYFFDTLLDHRLVGFVICLILIPMCLFSNMRLFAYLSGLAIVCTLLGTLLIFAYLFTSGLHPISSLPAVGEPKDLLIAFSIIMFSFEGISLMIKFIGLDRLAGVHLECFYCDATVLQIYGAKPSAIFNHLIAPEHIKRHIHIKVSVVLPIQSKMIDSTHYGSWYGVLNVGMFIVISLNFATGFFGYLKFGEHSEGSITLNVPEYPYWFAPIKPLFIVAILVSYLLQFYVPAAIFDRLMEKIKCHRDGSDRRRFIHCKLMRVALVFFSYVAAVTIPKLDLMISLIGSLASSMLAFVLPAFLELTYLWPDRQHIRGFWLVVFAKHLVLILIGLLSFVGGTVATLMQLIEAFRHAEP